MTTTFFATYGREPDVAWWAPGRVNLIGDHTDYSGGFVLPVAVPVGTTAYVAARDDGVLAVASAQVDEPVCRLELAAALPERRWTSYLVGAARVLADAGVALQGADLLVDSSVPSGAGLSSSASLVCATVSALLAAAGESWPPSRVALVAQQVEHEWVGAPVGVMDQMVAMLAREGHALLLDARSLAYEHVPLRLAGAGLALLVADSGSPHDTSGAGYGERVAQCAEAARRLGVVSLRDVTDMDSVERLADPLLRARARHVVSENARVLACARLLRDGRVREIGPLLVASHASLRDDFEVSTPALDRVVTVALAQGALGARLTGAGFGGSALVLVPTAAVADTTAAVAGVLGTRARIRAVSAGPGAHRVSVR